jgi:hypothetical protein
MTVDTEKMTAAALGLARRIAVVCDGEDATVVLAATAVVAGQSVFWVAAPKKIETSKVIEAFMADVKEWTARVIASHHRRN